MNNKEIGFFGENIAKKYLLEKNFKILKTNYTCKIGEIDLIAYKEDEIVFVEVKSRNSLNFGYPSEAVNYKKQNKILKTAKKYILENKLDDFNFRFDVIEIYLKSRRINHIENAFWCN